MPKLTRLSVVVWHACVLVSVPSLSWSVDCTTESLCGPKCLLAVCHKLGVPAGLEELKTLSGYDATEGTTMLGLQQATEAKGLYAVGMKIGVDDLAGLKVPAIGHLWDNHFVVVESVNADTFLVTSLPGEPETVPKKDFMSVYSGFALLVSKDPGSFPEPKAEGPDLRFESYSWDFGSIYEGDSTGYAFKCRNVGNADLVLSKVEASCPDCLVPVDWSRTIPPGGEGEIQVILDSTGERRGMAKKLFVASNDPISPVVHLDVVGSVKSSKLLMSPPSVKFGERRRSEVVSRVIYVPSTTEDPINVTEVSCDSAFVDVRWAATNDYLRPGYILMATLNPGAPLGEIEGTITILSDHPRQPEAEVSVTATIKGNIDLDQDSFFFGILKKGNEKKSTLTISTVGEDPLAIEKIDNPLSYVSVELTPKTEGKDYTLTATLNGEAPVGNIKGEIVIYTNNPDQPRIKVPVYAYVEG